MAKTVTLRIDNASYQLFAQCAQAQKRSLSNYIELAALNYSSEALFVDEIEATEIHANKPLMRRLKEGSRQAKAMKGRFV